MLNKYQELLEKYDNDIKWTKEEEEWYSNNIGKIFEYKIDHKIDLTEDELEAFNWELEYVDRIYGDNERWVRPVTTVIQIGQRYFAIDWFEGLTEYQSNYYEGQPYEVIPEEKVITTIEWRNK